MRENEINTLLNQVLATGAMPDDDTIRNSVTKYSSVKERTAIARKVTSAAKDIRNALDSGLLDAARQHADEVAEALSAHTSAGPVSTGDQPTWSRTGSREYAPDRPGTKPNQSGRRVADVLAAAAGGAPIGPRDLAALEQDVPEADRPAWRQQFDQATNEIRRRHADGSLGAARGLAREHGARLGAALRDPEPADPYDGVDDPRELANLVRARNGR